MKLLQKWHGGPCRICKMPKNAPKNDGFDGKIAMQKTQE
jgi:hypothetical protein